MWEKNPNWSDCRFNWDTWSEFTLWNFSKHTRWTSLGTVAICVDWVQLFGIFSIKIQAVNVACANTRVRLHFSRSAAPCCALTMYPVTCQWSHFTYPTEIGSELAGLTTLKRRGCWTPPSARLYFDRGPWKCCDGEQEVLLPWEEVSNRTASFFSHFGEI